MDGRAAEICIPRPTDGFSTCTRCSGLRSSSYGHDSSCKGAASSFRPRTVSHHRDAVLYGQRTLPGRDGLLLCSGCTRDDVSGKTSWPSATPIRSHVFLHQPGRPGTAVHVPHNIFFHTAPAWGSPDICRASSVFWAFTSSPASKKDRWRSSLDPSFFSC